MQVVARFKKKKFDRIYNNYFINFNYYIIALSFGYTYTTYPKKFFHIKNRFNNMGLRKN